MFEIRALNLVKDKFLQLIFYFYFEVFIEPVFSKGSGFTFTKVPGPGPGPFFKICFLTICLKMQLVNSLTRQDTNFM